MNTPNKLEVSDAMLMALADGELDGATAENLRERIEQDPDLAARYAIFTDTSASLRAAFDPGDVPARLVAAVRTASLEQDRSDGQTVASVALFRQRATWPLALAASLAVGIGLGWILQGGPAATGPASLADVAETLSDIPTGQPRDIPGLGAARVLGSFDTERGLCRLISLQPSQSLAQRFLACRDASGWSVALTVADGPLEGFSPANDAATEMFDLYLDAIGAGPPLDAQGETKALK
jgi:hypothetical protein